MRVLGVVRLSRTDAASTSIERQREEVERWAALTANEIVAWAVDEGVSGDVAPWERPSLGLFLPKTLNRRDAKPAEIQRAMATSRAAEWDAMVMWKLDRLSRRAADLLATIDWCRTYGRQVFETNGTEYTGPAGTLIVSVLGSLAQGERERMVERSRASFQKLARSGRWRGGNLPWGYRTYVAEDGHPYLEPDPVQAEIIRTVANRVIAGESLNSVCGDLNKTGVPTPSGRGVWRFQTVRRAITSDRMLGYMVQDGYKDGKPVVTRVVCGDDGLPVQRAEPILTRAQLETVRARLAASRTLGSGRRPGVRPDISLLSRVLVCGVCGHGMYLYPGRSQKYYRCAQKSITGLTCGNVGVPAPAVEQLYSSAILREFGETTVKVPVWIQGNDVAEDVARVTEALAQLRADRAAGLYSGEKGTEEFREQYRQLEDQRAQLELQPVVHSHWIMEDTGTALAHKWEESDQAGKNRLLRLMGFTLHVARGTGKRGQSVAARLTLVTSAGPAGVIEPLEGGDGVILWRSEGDGSSHAAPSAQDIAAIAAGAVQRGLNETVDWRAG